VVCDVVRVVDRVDRGVIRGVVHHACRFRCIGHTLLLLCHGHALSASFVVSELVILFEVHEAPGACVVRGTLA
jgi:hypothetical protein